MAHIGSERILIITHSYTPFINPRAFRWSAIAEKWAEQGKKVDVICCWLPGLLRCEVTNGVEIYRVGGGIIERMRALLRPKSRATTASTDSQQHPKNKSLMSYFLSPIRFFHDKIWKNLYWPDYACTWIGPASNKALELSSMENYSTVISVSDPFSSHLAGRKVKAQHPQINWLVDIGDPFCYRNDIPPNNYFLYRKLNIATERKIFCEADGISVTCQPTADKYSELFPNFKNKLKVIAPLLSLKPTEQSAAPFFSKSNSIRLLYIGTLYQSIRSPESLLKLFSEIDRYDSGKEIELHFIGAIKECDELFEKYKHLLGSKIFLHGLVGRDTVVRALQEADLLVNIGNNNRYQLPSKLVEYIALGKPILNLTKVKDDSSQFFLKDYPVVLHLNIPGNTPTKSDIVETANLIAGIPYQIEQSKINEITRRFNIDTIAENYSRVIDRDAMFSDEHSLQDHVPEKKAITDSLTQRK